MIYRAWKEGCRFDSWENYFQFETWQKAFSMCGIDPLDYTRERPIGPYLPWDFIETGTDKQVLKEEANKVIDII